MLRNAQTTLSTLRSSRIAKLGPKPWLLAALAAAAALASEPSHARATLSAERSAQIAASFQAPAAEPNLAPFAERGFSAAPIAFSDKYGVFMAVDPELSAFNVAACDLERRPATAQEAGAQGSLAPDVLELKRCQFLSNRWVASSPDAAREFRRMWTERMRESYESVARAQGRGAGASALFAGRWSTLAVVAPDLARAAEDALQGALRTGLTSVGFDRFLEYPSLERVLASAPTFSGANLRAVPSAQLRDGVQAAVLMMATDALATTLSDFVGFANPMNGVVAQRSAAPASTAPGFGG